MIDSDFVALKQLPKATKSLSIMQKTSRGHERTLSFKDKSHKVSAHFVTQVQKSSTEDSFEIKNKVVFFLEPSSSAG